MTNRGSRPKRTGYKYNFSGVSIKGAGAKGTSTSPASHSGIDHSIAHGQSSQLAYEMNARPEQIKSIAKSFQKLRQYRPHYSRAMPAGLIRAYKGSLLANLN